MNKILSILRDRNLLNNCTSPEKLNLAFQNKSAVYCGFDPTAPALHLGNLLQLITLQWFHKMGFPTIAVIGGGTAEIGDPSGKSEERVLQDSSIISANAKLIANQIQSMFPHITILNNQTWLQTETLNGFLRNIGKHFTINYLIAKDTVKSRLAKGISFTEFAYNLIQAYDFYYLYQNHNCAIQIGGSDQWGNITSGIELIRNKTGNDNYACGVTTNLFLKSDATKFGKTQSGTIWIDAKLTTPYELYQFFINQPDSLCEQLLKSFTFLTINEIADIMKLARKEPSQRITQKKVAAEVIKLVHGPEILQSIINAVEILFTNKINQLQLKDLKNLESYLPGGVILDLKTDCKNIFTSHSIFGSNRELKEFITNKAIKINGQLVTNMNQAIDSFSALHGHYYIVQKGKKDYYILWN